MADREVISAEDGLYILSLGGGHNSPQSMPLHWLLKGKRNHTNCPEERTARNRSEFTGAIGGLKGQNNLPKAPGHESHQPGRSMKLNGKPQLGTQRVQSRVHLQRGYVVEVKRLPGGGEFVTKVRQIDQSTQESASTGMRLNSQRPRQRSTQSKISKSDSDESTGSDFSAMSSPSQGLNSKIEECTGDRRSWPFPQTISPTR